MDKMIDSRKMSDVMASLVEGGAKVIFDVPANKVTITRQPQTAKVTKDVTEAAVVGVEVTSYGTTTQDAVKDAVDAFFKTCKTVDRGGE